MMNKKIARWLSISIFFVLSFILAKYVLGQCPWTACEDPMKLVTGRRWDKPGSPETVNFGVDQYNIGPDLTPDVTWAAAQWSSVQFNNETVKFKLDYGGRIGRSAGVIDGWNVVGWGVPLFDDEQPAETYPWPDPQNPRAC